MKVNLSGKTSPFQNSGNSNLYMLHAYLNVSVCHLACKTDASWKPSAAKKKSVYPFLVWGTSRNPSGLLKSCIACLYQLL